MPCLIAGNALEISVAGVIQVLLVEQVLQRQVEYEAAIAQRRPLGIRVVHAVTGSRVPTPVRSESTAVTERPLPAVAQPVSRAGFGKTDPGVALGRAQPVVLVEIEPLTVPPDIVVVAAQPDARLLPVLGALQLPPCTWRTVTSLPLSSSGSVVCAYSWQGMAPIRAARRAAIVVQTAHPVWLHLPLLRAPCSATIRTPQ